MQRLRGNIYVEAGYHGVTVGAALTGAGIVCLDTPTLPSDARKWRLQLAQLDTGPILYVVNSDHNRDRVLGNQWFEAPVIAHERTFALMEEYPEVYKSSSQSLDSGGDLESATDLTGIRTVLPRMSFSEEFVLCKGGREIHFLHRPGSASGAVWTCFPQQKIVFVGDTVFQGTHPFLADAQINCWIENLVELQRSRFAGYIIVPGRGKPTNKEGLKYSLEYLRYLRRRLTAYRKRRKPDAEALRVIPALLERYPVRDVEQDLMAERLQAGLEHAYRTLQI